MRCDPFVNDYILYRKGNRLKHLLGSGLVDGAAEHVFHIVHNGFFKGGLVKFHRIHRILLLTFQIRNLPFQGGSAFYTLLSPYISFSTPSITLSPLMFHSFTKPFIWPKWIWSAITSVLISSAFAFTSSAMRSFPSWYTAI